VGPKYEEFLIHTPDYFFNSNSSSAQVSVNPSQLLLTLLLTVEHSLFSAALSIMTKDWTLFKDEVRKLYWEENRPLKEVRRLMKEIHGFHAP
jgi:hypothetical protein